MKIAGTNGSKFSNFFQLVRIVLSVVHSNAEKESLFPRVRKSLKAHSLGWNNLFPFFFTLKAIFSQDIQTLIFTFWSWRKSALLRRFYTTWDVSGMSRRQVFLLLHMRKSFFYWHFPEMLIPLKSRIISTFLLRTYVPSYLNQSLLCIHVNKASHYKMAYSQSTV